jgi:hypothetical protein|tara:strand:+ start:163 stop:546 length:384 start_codon:yes stop_codon:yes gene_type:complete
MNEITHDSIRSHPLFILLIVLVFAFSIFLLFQNLSLKKENTAILLGQTLPSKNLEVVNFTNDFTETVLKSSGNVDLEDRLRLENDVREIGNDEILNAWKVFVQSSNEIESQRNVVLLIEALVHNIDS